MSSNSISFRRLSNLLRYEWAIDKRFYLLGTLGVFMIAFGGFLAIWFSNISGYVWNRSGYFSIFWGGFVFLSVFGIGQGFIDLREKASAIRYLTLPASTIEKYLAQILLRLIFPLFIYPIVFSLGANISVDIYYFIQQSILGETALPEITKASIFYLYWNVGLNLDDVATWLSIGVMVSIPCLMFMGGIVFKRWGFIIMPIAIALFISLMFGSYYALSWLIHPIVSSSGGDYGIPIGKPEVFEGIPLFVLVCLILLWSTVFLPFIVTYFKLKEREV